jgi:peptidoglycan/LPS O-acetylase OafA/YrhL
MKNKLYSIQLIRFIAVFLVVLVHCIDRMNRYFDAPEHIFSFYYFDVFGRAGVDIFFVISGFVMMYISNKAITENTFNLKVFLIKRALRVIPIYWLITGIISMLLIFYPSVFYNTTTDVFHTLGSYFFIPIASPEGKYAPLLGVGWTLNLEMFFYLIFGIFLFFKGQQASKFIFLFFCFMCSFGELFGLRDKSYFLNVITNPMLLEFFLGMTLFKALNTKSYSLLHVLFSLFISILIFSYTIFWEVNTDCRFITWGGAAFFLLFALISLEKMGKLKVPNLFVLLGDASYSIYLTHYLVIGITYKLGHKVGVLSFKSEFIIFTLCASLLLGYLFYLLIEKPLIKLLNKRVMINYV